MVLSDRIAYLRGPVDNMLLWFEPTSETPLLV